ncbi:hypothetical protein E2C01_040786 [Portunus trituberculatus]|uniref:Uncharacterized protein n=1 Tax=Portunus trituberculatus TaxID=210409 RepID=A0A5B7FKP2_PORTR|nr:hypothetical protein [Portunus trituberculatus]
MSRTVPSIAHHPAPSPTHQRSTSLLLTSSTAHYSSRYVTQPATQHCLLALDHIPSCSTAPCCSSTPIRTNVLQFSPTSPPPHASSPMHVSRLASPDSCTPLNPCLLSLLPPHSSSHTSPANLPSLLPIQLPAGDKPPLCSDAHTPK